MATPMLSTSFRAVVEPVLNEPFDGIYDQREDEYLQFMKEKRSPVKRAYYEVPILSGFQAAQYIPDGSTFPYDQGGVLFVPRFIFSVYGLAYAFTEVLLEDGDHIRLGSIYSEHLGQSIVETQETITANVLNRGFNAAYLMPGGDGVSLFSSSHPIAIGTASNLLTAAANLSQTSLEQMVIQMMSMVDDTGKKIKVTPGKLIVSPSNSLQGQIIMKSILRSSDANNAINPIRSYGMFKGEDPVGVVTRLTSSTAWFVKASNIPQGLQYVTRRATKRGMEGDFETDSMRYKASIRVCPGWVNWRDCFATPGA